MGAILRLLVPAIILVSTTSIPLDAQSAKPEFSAPGVQHRIPAPPPLSLGNRPELSELELLPLALVATPDKLEEIAVWNSAGGLLPRNGFSRSLRDPNTLFLSSVLRSRLPLGAVANHVGGLAGRNTEGNTVWAARVRVEGAYRLRLHLADVDVPEGTLFWVYGEVESVGPFGLELWSPEQGLWTPSVSGGSIHLEVLIPSAHVSPESRFTIDQVMEIFPLDEKGSPISGVSIDPRGTSCLVDAECVTSYDVRRDRAGAAGRRPNGVCRWR